MTAVGNRVRGAAIDAGLRPYRPVAVPSAREWDTQYESGDWHHLRQFSELARYSVIAGYVRMLGPARSLLDLGCGEGLLLRSLAAEDFERYLGVDVSSSAVTRAQDALAGSKVQFAVGASPPAGHGTFDVVVSNEVLYYLSDPAAAVDELRRFVDLDGFLVTSIWRHPGSRGLQLLLERRFCRVDRVDLVNSRERKRTTVSCWRPRDGRCE